VGVGRADQLHVQQLVAELGIERERGRPGDNRPGCGRADCAADRRSLRAGAIVDVRDARERVSDRAVASAAADVALQRARELGALNV
jgi:hypothetical protein